MEATHFIEVWKTALGDIKNARLYEIEFMKSILRMTESCGVFQTIAVWRIKPTDVPLEERLAAKTADQIKYKSVLNSSSHAF